MSINIESAVIAVLAVFTAVCGLVPKYKIHGGSPRENIALQNIQVTHDTAHCTGRCITNCAAEHTGNICEAHTGNTLLR